MKPSLFVALAIAVAWPAMASAAPAIKARCAAATAYLDARVAQHNRRRLILSDDAPNAAIFVEGSKQGRWAAPDFLTPADGPPARLVDLAFRPGKSVIEACREMRPYLRRHRIAYGRVATARATRHVTEIGYAVRILSVSLPVIDESGDEAILVESESRAPEDGGIGLAYLRRERGHWRLVAVMGLAVS